MGLTTIGDTRYDKFHFTSLRTVPYLEVPNCREDPARELTARATAAVLRDLLRCDCRSRHTALGSCSGPGRDGDVDRRATMRTAVS